MWLQWCGILSRSQVIMASGTLSILMVIFLGWPKFVCWNPRMKFYLLSKIFIKLIKFSFIFLSKLCDLGICLKGYFFLRLCGDDTSDLLPSYTSMPWGCWMKESSFAWCLLHFVVSDVCAKEYKVRCLTICLLINHQPPSVLHGAVIFLVLWTNDLPSFPLHVLGYAIVVKECA